MADLKKKPLPQAEHDNMIIIANQIIIMKALALITKNLVGDLEMPAALEKILQKAQDYIIKRQ